MRIKTLSQKTMRCDIEFIKRLTKLRAEKEIEDGRRISMSDITKQIIKCDAFNDLEKELLNKKLKLKFDGRLRL